MNENICFFTFSYCKDDVTGEFMDFLRLNNSSIYSVAQFIMFNSDIRAEFYRFIHDEDDI